MKKNKKVEKILPKNFVINRKITTFVSSNKSTREQMKRYKVIEIIRMLEADGWYKVGQGGSHRQFKHPTKKGRVTVNGKESDVLNQFLINSIFKQAGWR